MSVAGSSCTFLMVTQDFHELHVFAEAISEGGGGGLTVRVALVPMAPTPRAWRVAGVDRGVAVGAGTHGWS